MKKIFKVYPNVYFGIWNALSGACPLSAFPERVREYLEQMANEGILKIVEGDVSRAMSEKEFISHVEFV